MTLVQEMLEASPARLDIDLTVIADAINSCMTAAQACTSCANSSLAEEDVAAMRRCIARCHACADLCDTTMRALSRPFASDHLATHRLLQACVRACELCAEECERHAAHHRHCALCARACRACAHACGALLAEEAFEELQKLAGG